MKRKIYPLPKIHRLKFFAFRKTTINSFRKGVLFLNLNHLIPLNFEGHFQIVNFSITIGTYLKVYSLYQQESLPYYVSLH